MWAYACPYPRQRVTGNYAKGVCHLISDAGNGAQRHNITRVLAAEAV